VATMHGASRSTAVALCGVVLATGLACRSSTVDDAEEIHRREQPTSPMVEDRAGTSILKAVFLPVAALFSGGVSSEPDPARVRRTFDDSHGAEWSPAEEELFRSRIEAQWDEMFRLMREKQEKREGKGDR
jgi:hypothetical protein